MAVVPSRRLSSNARVTPLVGRRGHQAMVDDASKPLGKRHPGRSERPGQVAQVEMRVGVDQSRQQGDVAQVLDLTRGLLAAHGDDVFSRDRHRAVLRSVRRRRERRIGL